MSATKTTTTRAKVATAIAIGVGLSIYAVVALVILPTKAKRSETRQMIEDLEGDIESARAAIKKTGNAEDANAAVVRELVEDAVDSGRVLRSRLGNYLLPATEAIRAATRDLDIDLGAINEVGLSEIPQHAGRKTKNAFRSYTVRINVECGFNELRALLSAIERSNPYVCVSALTITAKGGLPESHMIGFDIQWPTWALPDMPDELLKAAAARGTPAPSAQAADTKGKRP